MPVSVVMTMAVGEQSTDAGTLVVESAAISRRQSQQHRQQQNTSLTYTKCMDADVATRSAKSPRSNEATRQQETSKVVGHKSQRHNNCCASAVCRSVGRSVVRFHRSDAVTKRKHEETAGTPTRI